MRKLVVLVALLITVVSAVSASPRGPVGDPDSPAIRGGGGATTYYVPAAEPAKTPVRATTRTVQSAPENDPYLVIWILEAYWHWMYRCSVEMYGFFPPLPD